MSALGRSQQDHSAMNTTIAEYREEKARSQTVIS
jgi:hypothetical protein